MLTCIGGSSATLAFDLNYEDGSRIDAQSITYRLYDKGNVALIAQTAVSSFAIGDPSVTVVITGANNTLGTGVLTDVRKVTLLIITGSGDIVQLDKSYIIHAANELSFMVGSYQTVQEAELTAYSIPNLTSFESATQSQKITALKEAFNRLGMMTYSVDYNYMGGSLNYVTETNTMSSGSNPLSYLGARSVIINKLNLLPTSYTNLLPAIFIEKLKVAQVIEAEYILSGDSESDVRTSGIVSEKVGESTTIWGRGKALQLPVSKRALQALHGYLYYGSILRRG